MISRKEVSIMKKRLHSLALDSSGALTCKFCLGYNLDPYEECRLTLAELSRDPGFHQTLLSFE